MSTLSAFLKHETAEDVLRLSAEARIALAFKLGDDDVALFCAATGHSPAEGRRILSKARQTRRRPSNAATG